MRVVEAEVGGKELRRGLLNAGRAAEVEDGIVQCQREFRGRRSLPHVVGIEEQAVTVHLSAGQRTQHRIPLAFGDSQRRSLRLGALPGETRLGIVLLGEVDQFGQRIGPVEIYRKVRRRQIAVLRLNLLFVGRLPRTVRSRQERLARRGLRTRGSRGIHLRKKRLCARA